MDTHKQWNWHHYFDAGHMMYTREADMMKLKRDLVAWLAG